jgi:hypothetical protein
MRGCGIPRGFWLKPGGSVDRVEGIIIETFVILCQYNSQIHRVPAGRIVTNKQTNNICFEGKTVYKIAEIGNQSVSFYHQRHLAAKHVNL